MRTNSLTTTCLFRSAFFLCNDCELSGIRFKNGNHTATFMIKGQNIQKLDHDYINGKALVNPILFKENLNRLRDTLTEELRERRRDRNGKRNHTGHQNQYRSKNLHRVQGYRV